MNLTGIYAITDEFLTPIKTMLEQTENTIKKHNVQIVQFRHKGVIDDAVATKAKELLLLCHNHNVLYIVNDHVDFALKIGADGVHVGKDEDIDIAKFKQLNPKFIIGVSCYDDINRAIIAQRNGADYVAFGAFFNSPTKPSAPKVNLEILKEAKKSLNIPVCAIGGVNFENIEILKENGADMFAMVSAIWKDI